MTPAAPEMIRLTDLAALRGIGKAAMSERVSKYEAAGLLNTVRDGRTKMIPLAAFEAAEAATVNLAKLAGAATKRATGLRGEAGPVPAEGEQASLVTLELPQAGDGASLPPSADAPTPAPRAATAGDDDDMPALPSGGYTKAQADLATYKAAIAKLELDQRTGKVVPVADVADAMARCAEALVRGIDQLAAGADDIAAAVAKNGASGARAMLKAKARELRELLAREMRLLGTPAEAATDSEPA